MQDTKTQDSIPTISEENNSMGEIKINHSVVASIVRLSATEIDGVYAIGSSIVEGITEIFSKKETDRGVKVNQDEAGHYVIEVRVILRFGVELAKVAVKIQENVRQQVERMTMNTVARVNVIIDGVKTDEHPAENQEHQEGRY